MGVKKRCIITGEVFVGSGDPNEVIAPNTLNALVDAISKSHKLRMEVASAIVQDQECVNMLSRKILNTEMTDVGISVPGTIAEFFRKYLLKKGKKNTRKVSK